MMKKYIIKQIARQYRARVSGAKTVQPMHLAYMYGYTTTKLVRTYLNTLSLWENLITT